MTKNEFVEWLYELNSLTKIPVLDKKFEADDYWDFIDRPSNLFIHIEGDVVWIETEEDMIYWGGKIGHSALKQIKKDFEEKVISNVELEQNTSDPRALDGISAYIQIVKLATKFIKFN